MSTPNSISTVPSRLAHLNSLRITSGARFVTRRTIPPTTVTSQLSLAGRVLATQHVEEVQPALVDEELEEEEDEAAEAMAEETEEVASAAGMVPRERHYSSLRTIA